ncbi:transferase [Kitasatospora sp. NE20-6]|uniref:exopolysaccharide biosynthesis polyprenyl glycosylphosphotransferase n=1 Tax=Kitasatospora sp. NE20-6 TaxID=2859066 RepID=UPI0034DBF8AA
MTIDHESVPRPGGPLSARRQLGTELLERPAAATRARPAAPLGRHRRPLRSRAGLPAALLGSDVLALTAAVALTAGARPPAAAAVLLTALLPLYAAAGLYRTRLTVSALDDLPALATRAAVAAAFAVTLDACLGSRHPAGTGSALRLAALLAAHTLLACLARAVVYRRLRRARRRRPSPTLVLGAGQTAQRIAAALLDHREYGLRPVGYLDSGPALLAPDAPLRILGGHDAVESQIRRKRIRHVIATEGTADDATTAAALRTAVRLGCRVWVVPQLREYAALGRRGTDQLWGFPCLALARPALHRPGWLAKRAVDVSAAGLGLLLLSPLLAAVALAVRCDTGPGVLFRQQRTGLDGQVFTLLKFRTLRPGNEHESATRWNISHDHRMGPVGRLLRRTSLDELPQLWNVVRGDMSLVGPRPERPYFVMRFGQAYPEYQDRHRVPVGLTGLAQVNGLRGDTSIEDRARFDNRYIESWSLWQDTKILLRTAALMLHPDGS